MMDRQLRSPSLGPIVGHTTSKSVRIWARAADNENQRTVGVAALHALNGKVIQEKYFRLHREFDRTGFVDFESLTPDTGYIVRTGSLALDSTDADVLIEDKDAFAKLPSASVWLEELKLLPAIESEARFRTFPKPSNALRFIFGSCRYPGFLWNTKRGDRIYKVMYDRVHSRRTKETPVRFVLMVGDQIYADRANALTVGKADTPAEFHERYLTAWGSPQMRRLMRSVPIYMILDDHEIEDNWERGRLNKDSKRVLFNIAIQYYQSYQWIHGPRNFGGKLYYSFESAGFPFFVIDTRTQRLRGDDIEDNFLLGRPTGPGPTKYQGQLDRLCAWLERQQKTVGDRPKFIVSSNVFVPNSLDSLKHPERSDSWPAFPGTRGHLLQCIVSKGINNVVFLSGDIHCSNVARMSFEKQGKLLPIKAYAITSSAFYWPFPFADGEPSDYVHDSRSKKSLDGFSVNKDVTMHYEAKAFEQEDNFTDVTVRYDEASSRVVIATQVFGKRGRPLQKTPVNLTAKKW